MKNQVEESAQLINFQFNPNAYKHGNVLMIEEGILTIISAEGLIITRMDFNGAGVNHGEKDPKRTLSGAESNESDNEVQNIQTLLRDAQILHKLTDMETLMSLDLNLSPEEDAIHLSLIERKKKLLDSTAVPGINSKKLREHSLQLIEDASNFWEQIAQKYAQAEAIATEIKPVAKVVQMKPSEEAVEETATFPEKGKEEKREKKEKGKEKENQEISETSNEPSVAESKEPAVVENTPENKPDEPAIKQTESDKTEETGEKEGEGGEGEGEKEQTQQRENPNSVENTVETEDTSKEVEDTSQQVDEHLDAQINEALKAKPKEEKEKEKEKKKAKEVALKTLEAPKIAEKFGQIKNNDTAKRWLISVTNDAFNEADELNVELSIDDLSERISEGVKFYTNTVLKGVKNAKIRKHKESKSCPQKDQLFAYIKGIHESVGVMLESLQVDDSDKDELEAFRNLHEELRLKVINLRKLNSYKADWSPDVVKDLLSTTDTLVGLYSKVDEMLKFYEELEKEIKAEAKENSTNTNQDEDSDELSVEDLEMLMETAEEV